VLCDLNENALRFTQNRVRRYTPEKYCFNILDVIPEQYSQSIGKVDSIALNYLFHCIPGQDGFKDKARVFDHLASVMTEKTVVFGSTIIGKGIPQGWLAKALMGFYNRKGIFHNSQDTLEDLRTELCSRFEEVEIDVVGVAAIFIARTPKVL
jgi:hypothetical protein